MSTTDDRLLPSPSGTKAGAGSGLTFFLTHSLCIPVPRWAPTPARRSSSFFLTLHTSRGHFASHGRRDLPLKKDTARSRSSWEERLTKAHDEREMRKIEEGPRHGSSTWLGCGIVALKYRQSSSCVALPGLSNQCPLTDGNLHIADPPHPVTPSTWSLRMVGFSFWRWSSPYGLRRSWRSGKGAATIILTGVWRIRWSGICKGILPF
jgi:hypothetical protein